MKKGKLFETKFGEIGIAEENGAVTNIFFEGSVAPREYVEEETPVIKEAARQLGEYFDGARKAFDFPIAPEGTAFELSVWHALSEIPFGETRSYRQIAERIGSPKACRAVGRANSRNPINIVVPCHRVIGSGGKLTGYSGGLDLKERFLILEGIL